MQKQIDILTHVDSWLNGIFQTEYMQELAGQLKLIQTNAPARRAFIALVKLLCDAKAPLQSHEANEEYTFEFWHCVELLECTVQEVPKWLGTHTQDAREIFEDIERHANGLKAALTRGQVYTKLPVSAVCNWNADELLNALSDKERLDRQKPNQAFFDALDTPLVQAIENLIRQVASDFAIVDGRYPNHRANQTRMQRQLAAIALMRRMHGSVGRRCADRVTHIVNAIWNGTDGLAQLDPKATIQFMKNTQ